MSSHHRDTTKMASISWLISQERQRVYELRMRKVGGYIQIIKESQSVDNLFDNLSLKRHFLMYSISNTTAIIKYYLS